MGIEKISGQAGYQSQAVQAAQASKVNVQPSSETNNSQDSVNNSAHTAAVMQISSSQKANTDGSSNGADVSPKQQEEQQQASIPGRLQAAHLSFSDMLLPHLLW